MNYLLIVSSVFLNCLAQLFMRKGMLDIGQITFSNISDNLTCMLANLWLWGALACYGVSVLLWIMVLSRVPVSLAFPLGSIGYVFVAIIGYLWIGESLDIYKISGILIICFGIFVLSKSS